MIIFAKIISCTLTFAITWIVLGVLRNWICKNFGVFKQIEQRAIIIHQLRIIGNNMGLKEQMDELLGEDE